MNESPSVETTSGTVLGHRLDTPSGRPVVHFGGVPYAEASRFAASRPVSRWSEPFDARRTGAAPPQRIDGLGLVPGMEPASTSEECLTAEVWTTELAGSKPIIVWIPGGSFRIGGAGLATYDGRRLAADGEVVVVGLNYRLGMLGFLAADGVPSNLGLRDLLAGIEWLRANAAAFGGDPERIVLMGESAGAGAIIHLLTRADLPVAGAIALSGSPTMTLDVATAELVAGRAFASAGVGGTSELADVPVDDLLDAQQAAVAESTRDVGAMPFHPWVDGDVVCCTPLEAAAAGALAAIPVVFGATAAEMELFRSSVPAVPAEYAVKVVAKRAPVLGLDHDGLVRGVRACGGDLVSAIADVELVLPALLLAESHARRGLPVWRARFAWASPEHGACHALDLPFHFGTLDVDGWRAFAGAVDDPAADRLSARLRAAWAAFAATGSPACEPVGVWPQWVPGSAIVELDRELRIVDDPDAARLASWRS